jgi:hypothetical protein
MVEEDLHLLLHLLAGSVRINPRATTNVGLVAGTASSDGGLGYQEDRVFIKCLDLSDRFAETSIEEEYRRFR